ncbi:MAG: hypothetical protein LC792_01700 [Actinobacteria bacterium]|nr:hypothetical protein [Actinomycetota bacterium]
MKFRLVAAIVAGLVWVMIPAPASATAYPFAAVPARYVYDPSKGSLHDYCTKSPDGWDRADFKGPCANHDLCYMDHVRGKEACDRSLRTDMEMNCGVAFDQDGADKDGGKFKTCRKMAAAYYGWVKKKGNY